MNWRLFGINSRSALVVLNSGAKIGPISASLQAHMHAHTNASVHNLELNCAMTKTHAGEYTSVV